MNGKEGVTTNKRTPAQRLYMLQRLETNGLLGLANTCITFILRLNHTVKTALIIFLISYYYYLLLLLFTNDRGDSGSTLYAIFILCPSRTSRWAAEEHRERV